MNGRHTRSMRSALASFAVAMAGLAAWAWVRFGWSIVTVAAVAIAIACVAAMVYAWWLGQRVLGPMDKVRGREKRRAPGDDTGGRA